MALRRQHECEGYGAIGELFGGPPTVEQTAAQRAAQTERGWGANEDDKREFERESDGHMALVDCAVGAQEQMTVKEIWVVLESQHNCQERQQQWKNSWVAQQRLTV